jgi:hypothetical protein
MRQTNEIITPDPSCPAPQHYASAYGYYKLGCICPGALEAVERKRAAVRNYHHAARDARRAAARYERDRTAEIDDCPALRHRHSREGYVEDGCRCPSTVKRYERYLEINREATRRYRQRQLEARGLATNIAKVDLRKADRTDAEAIAQGYRLTRVSLHTQGLAVKMMREANPSITDRQIAWRLTNAGQGRTISKRGGEPTYQPVSERQVQRILAALDWKILKHARRAGSALDRSGRAA